MAAPLMAVSLEALEVAVYHNRFEWHDVLVDCTGIVLGFATLAAWHVFAVSNLLFDIRRR